MEEKKKKTSKNTKKMAVTKTTKKKKDASSQKKAVNKSPVKKVEEAKKQKMKKEKEIQSSSLEKKDIFIEKDVVEEKEKNIKPIEMPFKPNKLHILITILIFVCMATYLGVLLFQKVSIPYSKEWIDKSYLVEKNIVQAVSCDQISNVIKNEKAFIYIKPTTTEEEFNLEKSLKKIIKDYHLENSFYVYELNDNCGSLSVTDSIISNNLNIKEPISKEPTILYYKNGVLVDYVKRLDQSIMNDGDFVQLLDIYEIKK